MTPDRIQQFRGKVEGVAGEPAPDGVAAVLRNAYVADMTECLDALEAKTSTVFTNPAVIASAQALTATGIEIMPNHRTAKPEFSASTGKCSDRLQARIDSLAEENEKLRQQVETLKEGLKPFARHAREVDNSSRRLKIPLLNNSLVCDVSLGVCRKARELVEESK